MNMDLDIAEGILREYGVVARTDDALGAAALIVLSAFSKHRARTARLERVAHEYVVNHPCDDGDEVCIGEADLRAVLGASSRTNGDPTDD